MSSKDQMPAPAVTAADQPLVEIVFNDDTDGFVNGKKLEPGKKYLVEAPVALANVQAGHARITGSEDPAATAKRLAKGTK